MSRRTSVVVALVVGVIIGAGGYAATAYFGGTSAACTRVTELEAQTARGPDVTMSGGLEVGHYKNKVIYEARMMELTRAQQDCPR